MENDTTGRVGNPAGQACTAILRLPTLAYLGIGILVRRKRFRHSLQSNSDLPKEDIPVTSKSNLDANVNSCTMKKKMAARISHISL